MESPKNAGVKTISRVQFPIDSQINNVVMPVGAKILCIYCEKDQCVIHIESSVNQKESEVRWFESYSCNNFLYPVNPPYIGRKHVGNIHSLQIYEVI